MDIIDSYNKLSLGKYAEIQAITANESLDDIDRVASILSVLTGTSEEEILHLPIAEFTDMAGKTKFLSAEEFKPGRIAKKYKVGDWELYPVTDFRKLETCQYIDFQTYSEDMDHHMVELISALLVPKGHRYNDGYDILALQEDIRNTMSVTDGVTIVAFFLTLCEKSIKDMLNYSRREAKGIKDKEKRKEMMERIKAQEDIMKNGVG